jgi:hypothetical protein
MRDIRGVLAVVLALLVALPPLALSSNHREAPITALDRAADITDWYAFVSYDDPTKVTMILCVDPLLDPSNGPNWFPFDPDIVYTMYIDNNFDAQPDIRFEFRFQTEYRAPGLFTGMVGAGNGIMTPDNAPRPIGGGPVFRQTLIPPAITALDGRGSEGLNLRQTYTVTMVTGPGEGRRVDLTGGRKLFAVPSNVGPRTMPDYPALARQGIYNLGSGVRVFAGTVDDPFYIDLGGTFDTLNLRGRFSSGVPGVLTAAEDSDDTRNIAPDNVAGYNVNAIAIEIPISMLTDGGQVYPASDPKAVIGTWAATLRPRVTIRRAPEDTGGDDQMPPTMQFRQVQRMGHPLINEVLIGIGSKDRFSMSRPADDSQFANFFLDPLLARVLNAATGGAVAVPNPPRTDLLPLVTYAPPIAPRGTPAGPVADMLRLNTGVPPTLAGSRKRLGALAGDLGGYPNGRRVSDDVVDIALRAVAGVLAGAPFNQFPNNALGDGVNTNDVPYQNTFPYVGFAQSGNKPLPTPMPRNLGSFECVRNPLQCTAP